MCLPHCNYSLYICWINGKKINTTQFLPKVQVLIKNISFSGRTAFGKIISHLVIEVRDIEGRKKLVVNMPLHKNIRGISNFFLLMGKVGSRTKKGEVRTASELV